MLTTASPNPVGGPVGGVTLADVLALAGPLRLVAVPVLGWAAYRDVKVRRVPTRTWYPLVALGAVLLAVDAWQVFHGDAVYTAYGRRLFLLRVGVSLGVVAPFSYLVWRMGGFGGADAKALVTLAVLFPTYPTYILDVTPSASLVLPHPAGKTLIGVFSLTILTNTVLLGASYPVVLTVRNLLARDLSPVVLVGRPVPVESIVDRHGSLLETPDGYTTSGLDVDALRMYLRWRGIALSELREDPSRFRLPGSVSETHDPTDGAVDAVPRTDGGPTRPDGEAGSADATGRSTESDVRTTPDEWAAERFLDDIDGSAYGTDPGTLREGLETVVAREDVWVSPGLPFIVPMFVGLLVALTYGDLLFGALQAAGLV